MHDILRTSSRPLALVTLGLAALVLSADLSLAQESGTAPRLLSLPSSTRAMALGDAYMMNSGHADAVFYHPGLVEGASGFGMDVQFWGGEGTSTAMSAAVGWFGGTVALGLQTLHFGAPDGTVASYPSGQDILFADGPVPTAERVASVAYAREFFGIRVGVVSKLIDQRIGSEEDISSAFDVGVATDAGPVVVGLSAQNIAYHLNIGSEDVSVPDRYTLGAGSYGRPVGPLDIGITGAVTYEAEEWIPAAGLEFGYWPMPGRTFVARVGARRTVEGDANPFSFGAAFWGDDLVLEWAYRPFGGDVDEGTHRIGVRWR